MVSVTTNERAEDARIAEVRAALARCSAQGGIYKRVAEERLGPALSSVDTVAAELRRAEESAAPVLAALTEISQRAVAWIGLVYEALWEAIGRPPFDAAMSLLFPGGASYYAEGSADERPDRMELLADLLEAGVHPKVAPERAKELAGEVRGAARSLRGAVDSARRPRARVKLLERAALVVRERARAELAGLRRRLSAEGAEEAEIEAVLAPGAPDSATANEAVPPGGLKLA